LAADEWGGFRVRVPGSGLDLDAYLGHICTPYTISPINEGATCGVMGGPRRGCLL
jgi:hypothetical protein